jgi:hypothetical protein
MIKRAWAIHKAHGSIKRAGFPELELQVDWLIEQVEAQAERIQKLEAEVWNTAQIILKAGRGS